MFAKNMKIAAVALVTLFTAGFANAASLSVIGGATQNLGPGYSLGASTGLSNGSAVSAFADGIGGGLFIVGSPATITMEFLGSETNNNNDVYELIGVPGIVFSTAATALYTKVTGVVGDAGLLPFGFASNSVTAAINGGFFSFGHAIAFAIESPNSVIALFEDGDGNLDFDDMAIRISVVPLPASFWLFSAALAGIVVLRASKKRSSNTV